MSSATKMDETTQTLVKAGNVNLSVRLQAQAIFVIRKSVGENHGCSTAYAQGARSVALVDANFQITA